MIDSASGGVVLTVRAIPRAKRPGFDGVRGGALVVRLASAPADGSANRELIAVVAAALDVPRSAVTISAGERSRQKRVRVSGIDVSTVRSRLAAIIK
jgi:uncharacterized protein (TIGR00251 family)